MAGARQVAILSIIMNQRREVGSKLLGSLDRDLSQKVTEHMQNLGALDPEEVKAVEARFYQDLGAILTNWIRSEP